MLIYVIIIRAFPVAARSSVEKTRFLLSAGAVIKIKDNCNVFEMSTPETQKFITMQLISNIKKTNEKDRNVVNKLIDKVNILTGIVNKLQTKNN